MEDFFFIDIPVFSPQYDENTRYGWSRYKDNLWELLSTTTGGYCMYCYDSICVNGQKRGEIEHGIEKINDEKSLSDCIPNLGIACKNCNGKYKRRGEAARKLPRESINTFQQAHCKKYDCKKMCNHYEKLRREYISQGKIILQPFTVKLDDKGHVLALQYDLLKGKYVPSDKYGQYTENELAVIYGHIQLFDLNGPDRINYDIGAYCKNVIDNHSIMIGVKYSNLVVDLFREKLEKMQIEEAVKICQIVYMTGCLNLAT